MSDKNYLTASRPYSKNVKNQKFYSCSMLTPNTFPLSKRDIAINQDVYGFQVHGVYEDENDMRDHCLKLQKVIKNFDVLPNEIGNVVDFDIDICDYEDAEIVYREEELNNINKKDFSKDLDSKTTKDEKVDSHDKDDTVNLNRYQKKDTTFVNQVKHHNYVCVSYITKDMLKNIPEKSKNKKFVGHIVHGVFEKYVDAQKYQHLMTKEYPMMVIDKVGEMNIVHYDLNVMKDEKIRDSFNPSLNTFMKSYLDALEEDGNDEKIRKEAQLQGAEIVTGKYDEFIGANRKVVVEKDEDESEVKETVFQKKETEEQKLERELKENSDRKEKLRKQMTTVQTTTDEFEDKLAEIKKLHNMKNT
jgi:hypothetical protein